MLLRNSWVAVCLLLVGCGSAVDGQEPGAEGDIGSSADALQTEFWTLNLGWHTSVHSQVPLTGAIRYKSPTNLNFSCGATFISPHYALTAAHCVDTVDLPTGTTFRVEQYDTSQVTTDDLLAQAEVDGAWPPAGSGYFQPAPIPTTRYRVTSHTGCKPVVGCDSTYLRKDCPFNEQVDIALIECPTRPKTQGYASVHPTNRSNAQVEVNWFHELVTLDPDPGAVEPSAPPGNWSHYGEHTPETRASNYHYSKPNHQLIPFRSRDWTVFSGVPYTQRGFVPANLLNPPISTLTITDVPICHGTSGSGVFERGTTGVFGVATNYGTNSRANVIRDINGNVVRPGRLCEDMSANGDGVAVAPQQSLMWHTQRQYAAALEATSRVQLDRQP